MHNKLYKIALKILPLALALSIVRATELSDTADAILTIAVIVVMLITALTED